MGGPEGEMGGPEEGTGGLGLKGGPLGATERTEEDGCPVVPKGGPRGGPLGGGANPNTGAGFTGFPQKVGRVDAAGDPLCTLVFRKWVHKVGQG